MSALNRAKKLLHKLKERGMCFDLMIEFFDRAIADGKDGAPFLDAAEMIHHGRQSSPGN